jgi:MFS family permease
MTQNDHTSSDAYAAPAPDGSRMSALERRASISLASIFALRMLGMFLLFPVLSLHADAYPDATPILVGWAIGIYGLTQALFQIPFGMLSDRLGRKRVIAAGLLVFALGSVVAALADTLHGVILGRAIQGVGAIAAAVMALAADLTREEHRTKAMAIIGVSIGMSFALAQVLGPVVTAWVGLPGLFWFTAVLALLGIAVLGLAVPNPVRTSFHRDTEPVVGQFTRVLRDRQLLRLDAGVLILHLMMTANFVALPLALRDHAGVAEAQHWMVYLGVLAASIALMVPIILHGERSGRVKQVLALAVLVLALGELGLATLHATIATLAAALVVYFTGFNVLEATLPSLVSRIAPADLKGTALAAFSTSQYLGAFIGGPLGGWLLATHGLAAVFATCAGLALFWLVLVAGVRNPDAVTTRLVRVGELDAAGAGELSGRLLGVVGVSEAVVVAEEGVAYLKVDRRRLDESALRAACQAKA